MINLNNINSGWSLSTTDILYSVHNFLGEFYLVSAALFLLVFLILPHHRSDTASEDNGYRDVKKLTITLILLTIIILGTTQINSPQGCFDTTCLQRWWSMGMPSGDSSMPPLKVDILILGVKIITLLGLLFVLILWNDNPPSEKGGHEDIPHGLGHHNGGILILLLGTTGVLLLVGANDLLTIYLAMELQALSFYSLAAMKREEEASLEGGLKYFVLGALSSGIFLFGASLIYGSTGLTNIDSLKEIALFSWGENINSSSGDPAGSLAVGSILIFIALVFKVGGAPFHMWLPDVYQGSPTIITAFFAIVPKLAILTLMLRLVFLDPLNNYLGYYFGVCAILSMVIGSLGALNQSLIKRLFAYSAISHIGYVFITFLSGVERQTASALILYMIIYMITSVALFALILSLKKQLNAKPLNYIIELYGLSRAQPVLTISLAFIVLSLAGIPPLAGFFAKWFIFTAAIKNGWYIVAILGILTSVVASVYYLKLISKMYMDGGTQKTAPTTIPGGSTNVIQTSPKGGVEILLEILSPIQKVEISKSILLGASLYHILFLLFVPNSILLLTQELTSTFTTFSFPQK